MRNRWRVIRKWLEPGLGIKRWLLLLGVGFAFMSFAIAQVLLSLYQDQTLPGALYFLSLGFLPPFLRILVDLVVGVTAVVIALDKLNRSILAPLSRQGRDPILDLMQSRSRRQRGLRIVAIGGGTGLPSVLRGFKTQTSNITAIVTMADDGGSSGKLRREMGVLPPGDLRNNIAALADDEDLMTQLFQYRFGEGGLEGHSFGNLFLTALANITGSMDKALTEAGRVLAIEGRVLPSTLQDVILIAEVTDKDGKGLRRIAGESNIPESGGIIQRVSLEPATARAYPEAIRAILSADLIVIGPGSLYTSILPSLMVNGVVEALRATTGLIVYICNIAIQKGETDNFTVADHVTALERHIGRGVFNVVLSNNAYPTQNAGEKTTYVRPAPGDHEIASRYKIVETDLTDPQRPWRHSPQKLSKVISSILAAHQASMKQDAEPVVDANRAPGNR